MGTSGSMLVKGVSAELKKRLREEAERNRRSVNQQVLLILEQATRRLPPIQLPRPVRPKKPFTHEWLMRAMREGLE